LDSTERLRLKMRRHYHRMSFFHALSEHYSRLTRLDCTLAGSDATEEIIAEFNEELEEFEAGEDTEEYE